MQTLLIVGTAGSGKSTLTYALHEWLGDQEQSSITVNLDPAAVSLPYEPDVDVRDMVDYDRIMMQQGLGPNAALIRSVREAAKNVEGLRDQVKEFNVDYVIVDTPGQLELFAFREEGRILSSELASPPKGVLFLFDPDFSLNAKNFSVSMFLSVSVYLAFGLPMILVLSKSDSVKQEELSRLLDWVEDEETFVLEVENNLKGAEMLLSREIARAVYYLGSSFPLVPVSATNFEGLVDLHAYITRMLGEGEVEIR